MVWAFCIRRDGDPPSDRAHIFDEEGGALHYLQQQVLEYQQNDYLVEAVEGAPHTFVITDPRRPDEPNHRMWIEYREKD